MGGDCARNVLCGVLLLCGDELVAHGSSVSLLAAALGTGISCYTAYNMKNLNEKKPPFGGLD